MLLEGMHIPLTTPFHPDGRLNLRKLEQNVARYSLTPASGLVVLSTTGEASLLSDDETRQMLATTIKAASSTKVMLANVSRDSVSETLTLCEHAGELGYDAVLVQLPAITMLSLKERRLYFQAVADRAALPVVLAGEIPVDHVAELAGHPRIFGWLHDFCRTGDISWLIEKTATVKRTVIVTPVFGAVTARMDAEPAAAFVSALSLAEGAGMLSAPSKTPLRTRTKTVGFQLLAARTERMLEGLDGGVVGVVPAFAAAAPQACHEVLAAWRDGDPALSAEKQQRLLGAVRGVERELGVAGIKYASDLNGYFGGVPRLPRMPLTGDQRGAVEALMAGFKS